MKSTKKSAATKFKVGDSVRVLNKDYATLMSMVDEMIVVCRIRKSKKRYLFRNGQIYWIKRAEIRLSDDCEQLFSLEFPIIESDIELWESK
mgnify:CR=1 FL=1